MPAALQGSYAHPSPSDHPCWPLQLGSTAVHLRPDKSVWWPDARTLFVADAHVGKATVFRARGLPVPDGVTHETLDALTQAVVACGAQRLVLLGDFLHAREAQQPAVANALQDWRRRHPLLSVTLVRGNHDRHAGDPPPGLGFDSADEPLELGELTACHHPQQIAGTTVLAGHWHPVARLAGRGRDALRLPAFWHSPGLLVLPSYGAFTGGHLPPCRTDASLYAVGGGRVWAL